MHGAIAKLRAQLPSMTCHETDQARCDTFCPFVPRVAHSVDEITVAKRLNAIAKEPLSESFSHHSSFLSIG